MKGCGVSERGQSYYRGVGASETQSWRSIFVARVRRAWYVLFMSSEGGMFAPGGGGGCSTRARRVRPSSRGRVRCGRASIGRWFLLGSEGVFVLQLRGR